MGRQIPTVREDEEGDKERTLGELYRPVDHFSSSLALSISLVSDCFSGDDNIQLVLLDGEVVIDTFGVPGEFVEQHRTKS